MEILKGTSGHPPPISPQGLHPKLEDSGAGRATQPTGEKWCLERKTVTSIATDCMATYCASSAVPCPHHTHLLLTSTAANGHLLLFVIESGLQKCKQLPLLLENIYISAFLLPPPLATSVYLTMTFFAPSLF